MIKNVIQTNQKLLVILLPKLFSYFITLDLRHQIDLQNH